jgi:hypothetical protein
VNNIRASARFLLDAIGPRAARMTILATAASLDDAIKSANANSEYLLGCRRKASELATAVDFVAAEPN